MQRWVASAPRYATELELFLSNDDENEVSSRTNNNDANVYDKENYEDDVNVEMT